MPFRVEVVELLRVETVLNVTFPFVEVIQNNSTSFTPQAVPTAVKIKEVDGIIDDSVADPVVEASTLTVSDAGRFDLEWLVDDTDDVAGALDLELAVSMEAEQAFRLERAVEEVCVPIEPGPAHVSY